MRVAKGRYCSLEGLHTIRPVHAKAGLVDAVGTPGAYIPGAPGVPENGKGIAERIRSYPG